MKAVFFLGFKIVGLDIIGLESVKNEQLCKKKKHNTKNQWLKINNSG